MRVSEYVAQRLAVEGITHVFAVQGSCNNDLIYAVKDANGIDYFCLNHEQAAGFAAEGYAKTKGVPGCVIATSGPGGQNLVTPIANCYYDGVPVVFITGQVYSRFMRDPRSGVRQLGFQEWPIVDVVRPITKYVVCVTNPNDVSYELDKALAICKSGYPGPVLLDLPIDVQKSEITNVVLATRLDVPFSTGPRLVRMGAERFIDDFWKAKKPVLLVGGGVRSQRAQELLHHVLSVLKVPAYPTWNALDVVTSDSPGYAGRVGTYGGAGRNFGIQNCDLLLALGTRVSGRITGGLPETFARGAKKYLVNIDPAVTDPRFQPQRFHENYAFDVEEFLEQVLFAYYAKGAVYSNDPQPEPDHSGWVEKCMEWKIKYAPVQDAYYAQEAVHPYVFIRELSSAVPSDAVIVNDCGGNAVVCNHAWETKWGQRYFSNNGNSPMGFAFAAAIGARVASAPRPVYCVIGDGGFCMNIQECQVVAMERLPIKTIILNNHSYGITRAYQQTHYGGRLEASTPETGYGPPDFVEVIGAFGKGNRRIAVIEVGDNSEITDAIQELHEIPGPVVCVVECPDFCKYEPRIAGFKSIECMEPELLQEEFEENMSWGSR